MVEVTQEDREAAATAAVLAEMRDMIRDGRADHHAIPWAAHREASEAEREARTVAAIVAWLKGGGYLPGGSMLRTVLLNAAYAIERGEWRPSEPLPPQAYSSTP